MIPPIASQFIAGSNIETTLNNAEELDENITPILNYLGEHYKKEEPVNKTINKYIKLINEISERERDMEISIKPTQIGLDISERLFSKNAEKIVEIAHKKDVFVWFDMEGEDTIDQTVESYIYLVQEYPNSVGLCLQANIYRTLDDIKRISKYDNVAIRLVKGAYRPKRSEYKDREKLNKRYKKLIKIALEKINGRVAIGSHDEEIINEIVGTKNTNARIEFQMLKGVREDRQIELSKDYSFGQYIPFGEKWLSYTYRRIRERPRNIFLILKSIR